MQKGANQKGKGCYLVSFEKTTPKYFPYLCFGAYLNRRVRIGCRIGCRSCPATKKTRNQERRLLPSPKASLRAFRGFPDLFDRLNVNNGVQFADPLARPFANSANNAPNGAADCVHVQNK